MDNEKTLYLIDGSAYIYRAYHAIRELSNSKGFPTNAIFGFTRMLMKLLEDQAPEYVVMLFDTKGPTFRHKMYEEYKANRPPMPEDLSIQIPHIKSITEAFNILIVEMPGYEADDLIGTLAQKGESAGFHVVMVTGDKDFIQLVTDKIIIWDPMKDKRTDANVIRAQYDLEPRQMVEVMGLSGDKADNVPGVPGIGQKTALSLIKTFGTMERLYEQLGTITKKKQRENLAKYRDQALLSRKLVIIDTDVPLTFKPEDLKYREPDNDKLFELYKELEFSKLQQDLPRQTDLFNKNYQPIRNSAELTDLINRLASARLFAIDTETTSKKPMNAKLVGLSFSIEPNEAFYIPCAHDYPGVSDQLELKEVLDRLKPILENPDIKKVGQNIKYDLMVLARHGINLAGMAFDTMLASYLLNPSKRAHNLNQIAFDFLDHKMITYEEVTDNGGKNSGFEKVHLNKAVPYACEDADITLMAYEVLAPELKQHNLTELFERVEMPLIPVLARMEMRGVSVDKDMLRQLSQSFAFQLEEIEKNIYSLAGEKFNIRSSQQLGQILFEKLKLPVQKKTKKKTGYSTDVDVLTTLAVHNELPALVLRHRTLAKLKSTYTDALCGLVHEETNRIHTSYNQTITATGRLSSSDPNLQNIPIRTDEGREIRRAFIPIKDSHLLSADYSQIELRILAHCSEDPILIKAFLDDEDIHTRTAAEVFQINPSSISSEMRRQAKVINFGIVYGMSAFGLSKQLGISQKMAKSFIDNYFNRYKGVKRFIDQTIEEVRETEKTSTLLGRIRYLPDIKSANRNTRLFAERTAINTPIQGTAADLIKLAMITVDNAFRAENLKTAMILTVHDELDFEVPEDELDIVVKLLKEIMEGIWNLKVPLKINIKNGTNWAEIY